MGGEDRITANLNFWEWRKPASVFKLFFAPFRGSPPASKRFGRIYRGDVIDTIVQVLIPERIERWREMAKRGIEPFSRAVADGGVEALDAEARSLERMRSQIVLGE